MGTAIGQGRWGGVYSLQPAGCVRMGLVKSLAQNQVSDLSDLRPRLPCGERGLHAVMHTAMHSSKSSF